MLSLRPDPESVPLPTVLVRRHAAAVSGAQPAAPVLPDRHDEHDHAAVQLPGVRYQRVVRGSRQRHVHRVVVADLMERVRHFLGMHESAPPPMSAEQRHVADKLDRIERRQEAIDIQVEVLERDRREVRRAHR